MEKYFALFPDDLQNDIYIAGESYGGQYIPYVADAILKRNENLTDGEAEYKLKALLIGNGLVSPDEQSLSYIDWFKEKSLIDDSNPKWSDINDAQKHVKMSLMEKQQVQTKIMLFLVGLYCQLF